MDGPALLVLSEEPDVLSRQPLAPTPTPSLASPTANLASIFNIVELDLDAVELQGIPRSLRTRTPVPLNKTEVLVFRNYVDRVSHWVSLNCAFELV